MTEQKPIAFMSYARFADEHDKGYLTKFCQRLSGEVQLLMGEEFPIFLDRKDIMWGESWKCRIENSLDSATFLIPIVSPGFFNSPNCRDELKRFIKREKKLERNDLILPVYYVDTIQLNDKALLAKDELAQAIGSHQYVDWRKMRFEELDSKQARIEINMLASQICSALNRVHSTSAKEPEAETRTPTIADLEIPTTLSDRHRHRDYRSTSATVARFTPETRIVVKTGDKPFFLSYSKNDEPFVIELEKQLHENNCWLNQWENKDCIFDFEKGIPDSRLFIVFWSKNAASSPWIQEEINLGRHRNIREKGYRIITIKLDDEPLPNTLANHICIDVEIGLNNVVIELNKIKKELASKEALLGKPELMEYFQNRESELNTLSSLAFSGSYSGTMILGIDGMGKTEFVRRSIYQLFSGLTPIWIDLGVASSPIRLLSSLAKPLSIAVDPEEAGNNPERFWSDRLFPEIASSEKTFIIFDNVLDMVDNNYPGIMNTLITRIFEDLINTKKIDNPNVIILSQRLPAISEIALSKCGRLDIGELDSIYIIRALNYLLSHQYSGNYSLKQLEKIADIINGYPLAIGLVATRISQHGIDVILEDNSFIRDFFTEVAKKLFSGLELSVDEQRLLTMMSVSLQPLNVSQMKKPLGGKCTTISRLIDCQIINLSIDGYRIHNILRDYILTIMSSKEDILNAHGVLAKIFKEEWEKALEKSASKAQYGSLAYYHSLSSGNAYEADNIKKEYLTEAMEAVKELYRRKEYSISLKYSEEVRRIHTQFEPTLDFYYGLSLWREKKSQEALPIMSNLVEKFPLRYDYLYSLGMIQRSLSSTSEAKRSFNKSKAIAKSRKEKAMSLSALADICCDEGEIDAAKSLAREAADLLPYESTIIATSAKILNQSGDVEEALIMLNAALKKSPNDSHLHSQIGLILKKLRLFSEAKEHLEIASRNPALSHTYASLADIYIELDDIDKAEKIVESLSGKESDKFYCFLKAKIFKCRKDFDKAEKFINKAIYLDPRNANYYSNLAQIKLDQADVASNQDRDMAQAYLFAAESALEKGLRVDANDSGLLLIKHSIDDFKRKMGF